MGVLEVVAVVEALVAVAVAIWGIFKKRSAEALAAGILIVEQAIEENKTAIKRMGPGRKITKRIKLYGPEAVDAVDKARAIAHRGE